MSCYHPQLLHFEGLSSNGQPKYKFTGKQASHTFDPALADPRDVLIPCRKCIGCRLDYSRRWADRLMLELDHSKTALFLTLTFDNDHITPAMIDEENGLVFHTLVKRDLQLFNKKLRYHFRDKEIRFFAAGEYGSLLRPHFHGIYFGLSLDDFPDHELLFRNHAGQPIYTSNKLSSIWENGFVSIGKVSWQSCAYVARYNLKKLNQGNDNLALSRNCLPEFSLMSRRPGIGGYFPLDHPEIFDNPTDKIVISDPNGVRSVGSISMPSYIFQKLQLVNPELYDKIKEEKKVASLDSFLLELSNTDLNEFEYLNLKEFNHGKKASLLRRSL